MSVSVRHYQNGIDIASFSDAVLIFHVDICRCLKARRANGQKNKVGIAGIVKALSQLALKNLFKLVLSTML
jgi:hypothetical protein